MKRLAVLLGGVVALYGASIGAVHASPASPDSLKCAGLSATMVGTNSNDVINGTSGDDVIIANGGDDTVNGGPGNDVICGGNGDDTLRGGNGEDVIYGGPGHDDISGNAAGDELFGYPWQQPNDPTADDFWDGFGFDNIDGGANNSDEVHPCSDLNTFEEAEWTHVEVIHPHSFINCFGV